MSDAYSLDAAIAGLLDRPVVEVPGPNGQTFYLRPLSVGEREAIHVEVFGPDGKKQARLADYARRVLVGTLAIGPGGERVADSEALNRQLADANPALIEPLTERAFEINGLGERAREALEKNSAPGPSAGSSSG